MRYPAASARSKPGTKAESAFHYRRKLVPSSELSSGRQRPSATGTSAAFPRCGKRLRGGGDPVWWGSQTSTGATPESAWKWRAPSTTRVRARACCRWRRCGFAWPTGCRPTQKTNPIRSKVEVPRARSRPRALTTPAPSRAGSGGGARSRPVRPGAGIPRQSCDIVRTGPFVATTRPSAHAFRMHAGHADRNRRPRRDLQRKVDESQSGDHAPTVLRRPERARR